jgi:alkane 1-monooxygenase
MSARIGSDTAASPAAALPYALGFLLPPLVSWSVLLGGTWTWLPVAVLYAGFPLVDALARPNPLHPSKAEVVSLEANPWFRLVTWLWVPVHLWLVVWAIDTAARLDTWSLSWWGLMVSVGSVGGAIGITFAHELVHRSGRAELALGDILLALVTYPHFAIEHVYGHHRYVATRQDPASARLGESFYRFLPRTLLGSLHHAWVIGCAQQTRRDRPWWHPANVMFRYAGTVLFVIGLVATTWGTAGLAFFVLQSIVAFTLLEAINYVEHYGLARREIAPGKYEPVAAAHSWDSNHRISNWLLINLARHADHHLIASRRYPALATTDTAPQLPAGYGTMLLVAMVPPLWRRVMDPRVPPRVSHKA